MELFTSYVIASKDHVAAEGRSRKRSKVSFDEWNSTRLDTEGLGEPLVALLRRAGQVALGGRDQWWPANTADSPGAVAPRLVSNTAMDGEGVSARLEQASWNLIRLVPA